MISNNILKVLKYMTSELYTRQIISKNTNIKEITLHNILKSLIKLELIEIVNSSRKKPLYYSLTEKGVKMQEVLNG